MELVGDVAGGVDVSGAGAAELVHQDAVLLLHRRREGRHVGLDPDADDCEIALNPVAVGGHGGLHALGPFEGGDVSFGQQLGAFRAVKPADHRADLLAQNPFKGYALREGRGHPNPELRQGGRDLAADEAHAQDHRVAIRHSLALDRIALGHRSKLVDSGQLGPGDVEPPVPAARGDQNLLVLDLLARLEDHLVLGGIHLSNGRLEPFDIVLLIPGGGSDVPPVEILLRPEVGLGQRGTTEWDPRFVADDHDSAAKSLIPKSRRGVPSGETATDNDDGLGTVLRRHRSHSFSGPRKRVRLWGSESLPKERRWQTASTESPKWLGSAPIRGSRRRRTPLRRSAKPCATCGSPRSFART
jgi:hypothetical protein